MQMILNAIFPVFFLILAGVLLKHIGVTHDDFLSTADRLLYFILFPALLFWKIAGGSESFKIPSGLIVAALLAVLTVYLLSTLAILIFRVGHFQAGTFSQSCYRFNTYVGMAVVMNALGDEGVRNFSILIGFTIPVINVLAVSTLIWFGGQRGRFQKRVQMTLKAIVTNPLIIACMAGIVYSRVGPKWPAFIENTFHLASNATLPLALLSIGGALTLKSMLAYWRLSLATCLFKMLVLPMVGYLFLHLMGVTEIPYQVGMLFFALPTSTALYVLSAQLNSDTRFASAAIALSTLLSFFSLSVVLLITK
jgi:predicted permease